MKFLPFLLAVAVIALLFHTYRRATPERKGELRRSLWMFAVPTFIGLFCAYALLSFSVGNSIRVL